MAAVSSQPVTLTPPDSSHEGKGLWEYSVPLDHDNAAYSERKRFMSEASSKSFARQPYPTPVNGSSSSSSTKVRRTNTLDSERSNWSLNNESGPVAPPRVAQLSSKQSVNSTSASDSDSLLDLYKQQQQQQQPAETRNGRPAMATGEKRKAPLPEDWHQADKDDSNWIHRDKLAQIESKELEEAGFRVRRSSRSSSSARRDRSLDKHSSDDLNHRHTREDRRQRIVSPIPTEAEEDERMAWDLRSPEEVAADHERSSSARPGTSRIPIAKASPLPLPNEVVERDCPLPRSRHGSVGFNGSIQDVSAAFSRARARSGSVGSQVLLDDVENGFVLSPDKQEPATSSKSSPTKAKVPSKNTPAGAKKGNQRSGSQTKSRNGSGQNGKRPGTSGNMSRPVTSHKPEGDPPWIATMYKPDPSLPPDQQIIPTHARKLAQEQWEREGKTGSVYDREFRLLNTDEFGKPPAKSKDEQDQDEDQGRNEENEKDNGGLASPDREWPLPLPSPRSDRPSTGGTEHGGYKTMPTISSPKIPQQQPSPKLAPAPAPPKPEDVIRIQDPPEEAKQKKGCCCIIM